MGLFDAIKYPKVGLYKRAIKMNSSDHQLRVKLGEVYLNIFKESGREDFRQEAIKSFEEARQLGNTNAVVFLGIGEFLEETDNLDEAKKIYREGIDKFVARVRTSPSCKEEHALNVVQLYKKVNKLAAAGIEIDGVREQLETVPKSLLVMLDDLSKK